MDEKDLEKQQQQAEKDEASKKTAHVAGKAAATYFGGGLGGKAYDLASKTKAGQKLENTAGKLLQKQPGLNKAMDGLNKSGALDAADKVVDAAGGGSPASSGSGLSGNALNKPSASQTSPSTSNATKSKFDFLSNKHNSSASNNEESTESSASSKMFEFFKEHKMLAISVIASLCFFLLLLILIIIIVSGLTQNVNNFINGIYDFFTTDQQELEEDYYNTLKEVQTDINNEYGICIDINLITAALTINTSVDDMLEEGQEPSDENSYKKMKKQIKLLANMQMLTKKYVLDNSSGSYCSESEEIYLITEGDKDSSTKELVAQHDLTGFAAFFTKKSNEEKNWEYYVYKPPFDIVEDKDAFGRIQYNADGSVKTKKVCNPELPGEEKEFSIGTLETREDSVFYWNLVNSFIPDYYDEYLPDSEPERTERVKEMADEIYLLYTDIGPSQTCTVSYAGPSSLCPNGITVEGAGTLNLEDYIAGVVSNEAYTSEGMEALKAQAVAARTYALKTTNYCQNTIENSTNAQTFTQNINDRAREAAYSTQGEILVDRDGNIFSSQYDSFCYDDKDCPDAKQNPDGTYTVTYTKVPYGEKHTITLSDSSQYGRITHGQGHARGMSQLLSYQLAKEGKSYREILSYFYSDGVELSLVLSPTNTDGASIVQNSIGNYLANANSSIESMNTYIYDQVIKSGLSTREGVVAAATSLISGIYNQTGYKIPYELYPSGKYSGYGIDPDWGTNTGRTDYPLNGLDCSGFISWAIHNGGYSYVVKNAEGWGNSGNKRAWSKGTTDSGAQPGDLIFNAPSSANGTSGHIRMIIGVTDEGYIVAEASSRKNGVRITNISFTSTGSYYLVDMTSYYQNATKVTDYPM